MKKLLLTIVAVAILSLGAKAQDSTSYIPTHAHTENIPGGPTFNIPKTYISIPTISGSKLHLSGDFTLETWVYPRQSITQNSFLIESYSSNSTLGGIKLRLDHLGRVQATVYSNSTSQQITGDSILPVNEWTHIAVTFDNTTKKHSIYLNGVLDKETTVSLNQHNTNSTLYIGAQGNDQRINHDYVKMDEVRIWSTARTIAEIKETKDKCLLGNETGLVAYYNFENLQSTTPNILDITNNNNDGTLVGGRATSGGVFNCITTSVDQQIACKSFEWINEKTYYSSTNTTHLLLGVGVNGYDSLITLNLIMTKKGITVDSQTITASETEGTYRWLDCNDGKKVIAGETMRVFQAPDSGNYAVEITKNGCVDTSACVYVDTIPSPNGIINKRISSIKIYPNPATSQLTIETNMIFSQVQIIDLTGKIVKRTSLISKTISVKDLPKGMYILKLQSNNGVSYSRFVKE